jgi:hypothetical protein
MAKSFQEKKQEIFNYLDRHSKEKHFHALSEFSIHKKFDELFGKKIVEDILDNSQDIDFESLSYSIYYPLENRSFLSKFLEFHSDKLLIHFYLITTILWLIIFNSSSSVQTYLFNQMPNLELNTIFINGFIISFFVILFSSKIFYSLFIWIRDKKIMLKDKKSLLFYIVGGIILILVIGVSQLYFPKYLSGVVGITAILIWMIDKLVFKFRH